MSSETLGGKMKNIFKSDRVYTQSINSNGIFTNSYDDRMPQYIIKDIIIKHFENSDKKPKCLFIGWDGCRADAMKYLVKSNDKQVSGANDDARFSAICELKKSGGLYITYVGGDNGVVQETSTAQGWASALCGKWMKKPWRIGIEWSLDDDYPTALRLLSQKGYKTSFIAEWPVHFDNTYKGEIDFAQANDLPQYFYKTDDDEQLYAAVLERLNEGDDCIVGIFENPDSNGHDKGFGDSNYRYVSGVCHLDRISYSLLKSIKSRESFCDEDWLIVIASDHGGHSTRHGTQKIEDRTTFLALSKPVGELAK